MSSGSLVTPGSLVKQIQSRSSEGEVVEEFCTDGVTSSGFSEQWVKAVFHNRPVQPQLDLSVDVHGQGVNVLNYMGISEEVQSQMWARWALLPDDEKASWVEDWKSLDTSDQEDIFSYVTLLVDLLK